jgi:hypothetical protein
VTEPMVRILERGDIAFFLRPRRAVDHVRSLDDVARLVFVMRPEDGARARLAVVGRKRLPDPSAHERAWALVAKVEPPDALPTQSEAPPIGAGRYVLADHDGHSHLAYALAQPSENGEARRIVNVEREASYIVAVRNPAAPAPPGAGLPRQRRAELPPQLRERFAGRRWHAVDDPAFLDHAGVELVLIGAAEDVEAELGIELDAEVEALQTGELLADLRDRSYARQMT